MNLIKLNSLTDYVHIIRGEIIMNVREMYENELYKDIIDSY